MIGFLKSLFGPGVDYKELVNSGATIIDVRSKDEFAGGHVKGSVNIPLDVIDSKMEDIKEMGQPIITCCASGIRSGSAKNKLKAIGLEAYNGGGWASLNSKL